MVFGGPTWPNLQQSEVFKTETLEDLGVGSGFGRICPISPFRELWHFGASFFATASDFQVEKYYFTRLHQRSGRTW